MSLSMYQASVPVCIRMLNNFIGILEKGQADAEARGYDPAILVTARLYPDMFPLARQVQVASDIARRGGARLAGQDPAVVDDDEQTLEDLIGRVRGVIDFLETLRPDEIDGSEERAITFQLRGREVTFDGQTFLLNFVLPNVYFHITTAYNILRHNGVVLGKPDFLGGF